MRKMTPKDARSRVIYDLTTRLVELVPELSQTRAESVVRQLLRGCSYVHRVGIRDADGRITTLQSDVHTGDTDVEQFIITTPFVNARKVM